MMLENLHETYKLLANCGPATRGGVELLELCFGSVPDDYLELISEATYVEIEHDDGQYIRIWAPGDCVESYKSYKIDEYIPTAVPIGDDGGGEIILYVDGGRGFGLYHVNAGDLDLDEAVWIASSLRKLLTEAKGIESF
ncbi:MAG: SMI1/KNR4 family protein [Candidatus Hydrogenedentes bacterium]|nr:SMI1/KNR4 family protein [Candidatus Hydrogenedentota bacterium]